jgi:phage-related protein
MKKSNKKTTKKTAKKKVIIEERKDVTQREWKIRLYTTADGKCPMKDFMKTLSREEKAEITDRIKYLKIYGHKAIRPRAAYLRDKIYELRMTLTTTETRALYFFYNDDDEIVLTHAFYKKTQAVSESEINKAIKYKNDYLQRYKKVNINEKTSRK